MTFLQSALICKDVISYFSYHKLIKAHLVKGQTNRKLPALAQPAVTQWGTLKVCFVSLLKRKSVSHCIATSQDVISGTSSQKASAQDVNDIVTSKNFIPHLNKSIHILKSIHDSIVHFQTIPLLSPRFATTSKWFSKKEFQSMQGLVDSKGYSC